MDIEIRELFQLAIERDASDLHLVAGVPPIIRIDGKLIHTNYKSLTSEDTKQLIYGILNEKQKNEFENELELDFSLSVSGITRCRVNVHIQRGSVEAAFRFIKLDIKNLGDLGLPPIVAELTRKMNGLVLITGPTGVGKTTTLASMVDLINTERDSLIITIEDPIEYIHKHKKSVVKQREVFSDTNSFGSALKHILRQDPDVVVIGEMRDLETISTALTAAETGHLVLATLHTPDAAQTIHRIIDVFPPYQQQQITIQLADCLQGIISQQLLQRSDRSSGRIVATEILIATAGIRNLIREKQIGQIPTMLQTGSQFGMKTMDKSLKELYRGKLISYEDAIARVKNPEDFDRL